MGYGQAMTRREASIPPQPLGHKKRRLQLHHWGHPCELPAVPPQNRASLTIDRHYDDLAISSPRSPLRHRKTGLHSPYVGTMITLQSAAHAPRLRHAAWSAARITVARASSQHGTAIRCCPHSPRRGVAGHRAMRRHARVPPPHMWNGPPPAPAMVAAVVVAAGLDARHRAAAASILRARSAHVRQSAMHIALSRSTFGRYVGVHGRGSMHAVGVHGRSMWDMHSKQQKQQQHLPPLFLMHVCVVSQQRHQQRLPPAPLEIPAPPTVPGEGGDADSRPSPRSLLRKADGAVELPLPSPDAAPARELTSTTAGAGRTSGAAALPPHGRQPSIDINPMSSGDLGTMSASEKRQQVLPARTGKQAAASKHGGPSSGDGRWVCGSSHFARPGCVYFSNTAAPDAPGRLPCLCLLIFHLVGLDLKCWHLKCALLGR